MLPSSPQTRREAIAIALLTLVGACLRLRHFGRLGLSHFDEGAYAMVGLWVTFPGGFSEIHPDTGTYAPPGYPFLVGLAYLLVGFVDSALLLVSEAFGIAAIPLVGWLGRRTFGPGAGAAAAGLAALSGAHASFSRVGLTDASFLVWWLLALGLGARFLERPRPGRALALGLAVGGAQLFKYNGWIAGLVVALAAVPTLLRRDQEDGWARARILGYGALAAATAVLAFLPWYLFVEARGGYARLLAHHRSYVSGPLSWPEHLRVQLAQVVALSGGPAWCLAQGALAWGARSIAVAGWPRRARALAHLAGWMLLAGVGLTLLPTIVLWWSGLAALPWLLREDRPARRVLAMAWLVPSLLTPLYHPYARLWLPLHGAGWLIAAGLLGEIQDRVDGRAGAVDPRRVPGWIAAFGLVLLGWALVEQRPGLPRARPLAGLQTPTDTLRRKLTGPDTLAFVAGAPPTLRVLARPVSTYYLGANSPVQFRVAGDLGQLLAESQPGERALVDEAQLRLEAPERRDELFAAFEVLEPLGWVEPLGPVTLLDVAPEAAFGETTARACHWWLLQKRAAPPPNPPSSPRGETP